MDKYSKGGIYYALTSIEKTMYIWYNNIRNKNNREEKK